MQKFRDNYSLSLKSMSKTISPFSIILTMTHMMEFVSSAASIFVTWDVIWILMMSTFSPIYTWLENIYVYTNLWDGRVPVLMDLECLGTLGFFNVLLFFLWMFAERSKRHLLSYLIPQFNRAWVILLNLVVC